ncbi:MAG TPA: hypothetical protein VM165_12350 [Planctomycetaceae bacterium]|nr:hypothetical protein [Planctomycetaceae bacterium]
MTFALQSLAVFVTTLCGAWCWVLYLRYSTEGKALKAALADCAIIGLGMFNVVSYTDDHRLGVPILAAAFLGTFFAVRRT